LPSLFEARRRLPTSATAYFDVRATKPGLFRPRRDGDLDLLPFLIVSRPLPCGSGDTRRAAHRPMAKTPVLVPLGCPSLPNRDVSAVAPPPRLAPTEHSEDRRARVGGPSEGRVPWRMQRSLVRALGACAWSRMLTAFPSSASSGHPLSSARHLSREDTLERRRTDLGPRSDDAPRREPPSRKPGCLQPPRHAKDEINAERLLPPAFAPALSLTPPALGPLFWRRTVLLMGIARSRYGHPRVRDRFESADTFFTRWNYRAWD